MTTPDDSAPQTVPVASPATPASATPTVADPAAKPAGRVKKSAKIVDSATTTQEIPMANERSGNVKVVDGKRASLGGGVTGLGESDRRHSVVVEVRQSVRHKMLVSGWYTSDMCVGIRKFLRGKSFANVSMVALFVALFLPDLFCVLQVPTNLELDIVLTVVMALFAFEFIGLSFTDPSYLFGFFFCMDLIGTLSMILDVSYLLGSDATKPQFVSGSAADAKENLIVVRAARAAKLGARAGRISRVLKMLRFLPFIAGKDTGGSAKMAKVISNQLTNVLSTRVACLTIVLVVILPVFSMFTHPEDDHSMRTWAQLLDLSGNDRVQYVGTNTSEFFIKSFDRELARLTGAYDTKTMNYGPCGVCIGSRAEDAEGVEGFTCRSDIQFQWNPQFEIPARLISVLQIPSDHVMVSFNMAQPYIFEAAMQMILIFCIIIIMCLFGLMLSSSVSQIALRPLERMLDSVRDAAKSIFKFTAELQQDDENEDSDDEEYDDIEQASEFDLLEKVVKKLAVIAELNSSKQEDINKENMGAEDLGVLQFMSGGDAVATSYQSKKTVPGTGQSMQSVDDLGISTEAYNSWDLDVLELTKAQKLALCGWITMHHQGSSNMVVDLVAEDTLTKFVTRVESEYMPNPYHNFAHAVDVVHAVARMMKLVYAESFLSEIDQFSLLLSAIAHDLAHPGVNNPFLVETSHELAVRYNDKSPLENMHCAKLFEILTQEDVNVLQKFTRDQYKEVRKVCIECILHTDMVTHFPMVKDLGMLYQMNTEVFDDVESAGTAPEGEKKDLFQAPDNKKTVMNLFLHSADVGNPAHPWTICSKWAFFVLDEFFAQGDQEKVLGITVQMLNDRDKVNKPNSQIGFIEFLVVPLFVNSVKLFPTLHELSDNLASNAQKWADTWERECSPAEEEAEKVRGRVGKIKDKTEEAKAALVARQAPRETAATRKSIFAR